MRRRLRPLLVRPLLVRPLLVRPLLVRPLLRGVAAMPVALALALASTFAGCRSDPPAPSPQGVNDTAPDFLAPGSTLQGVRRIVVMVDPARLSKSGGYSGTFTLTNRGQSTVILASVETSSNHVRASSPGAMPYRVDPGKSFSVTVSVNLPWDRALSDGGIARVLTTEGETINLWLQLVTAQPAAPARAAPR